jgi:Type III restriction enzyme, res subunit/HNH endonuclease
LAPSQEESTVTEHHIPRKPTWLSQDSWIELLRRYGGVPRCERTGETTDLSVDHIVPRWAGGGDDVSNLQFLTSLMNARKGIRDDRYWAQRFYWDQVPNLDAFRGAQRMLFGEITDRSDWFGRPISQIARRLYVNAWVVAAGKTVGIAAAAWALNHVIRERWGAAPRAGCVLIVTKERAVRDQIAGDLPADIVRYGIHPQPPRVGVVEHAWQFEQEEWLDQHDAVVTTVQMIWEREGGMARSDLAKVLARFPVIAFDEPHFAADQVSRLVEEASGSVCLGFTGTPIDAAGRLLQQMVALTVYGYDQANYNDQSLKWLDSDPGSFRDFVREIGITEARVVEHGARTTTDDPGKEGYDKNIEPAKSVVRDVVDETKRRDQLVVAAEAMARHRDPATVEMNGIYPAHPMIVCDNVATARALCENTNKMFERDPLTYPPTEGWRAEVVYTDTQDAKGERIIGQPLTPAHPWLRSKGLGYRLDAKCARLLFVVGIGREGVNNPACGPVGIATSQGSVVEIVQRAIGRQLRAVTSRREGSAALLVPPAPLDTVLIVTHETFRNTSMIARAIAFVCDMEDQLAELPSIDDLDGSDPKPPEEIQRGVTLMTKEKIDIAARLGMTGADGSPVPIDEVVTEFAGLDTGPRVGKIREWATRVRADPDAARREIHLDRRVQPGLIVTREQVRHDPTDSELERHLKIHNPEMVGRYVPVAEDYRELITALYAQHASLFHLPPLTSDDHIDDIRRDMARRIRRHVGDYFTGEKKQIYSLVGAAVKTKLGVPEEEKARNDSDWDTPQVHALLRRPDVQAEIIGWVTGRLIDDGLCPALSALRASVLVLGDV